MFSTGTSIGKVPEACTCNMFLVRQYSQTATGTCNVSYGFDGLVVEGVLDVFWDVNVVYI
jgi:hypothetical protein